jgi:hypothetical protein
VALRRRRARALDLAVLQAETAQLQVETLRGELSELHHEFARRDVEMLRVLTGLAAATDRLQCQLDEESTRQDRLARSIERLALFALAPRAGELASAPPRADHGSGRIIGGSVDPSRDWTPTIDLTAEITTDVPDGIHGQLHREVPLAPATADETPLDCEVHLQFGDTWIRGFQIEETIRTAGRTQFRLRRQVDGWVLPELFDEREVRVFTRPVVETPR